MPLILDIQGFKLENNKFIVKELAAYDGSKVSHYVFKPPFDVKLLSPQLHRQMIWVMNNHHCIDWREGYTPIHKFEAIVKHLTVQVDVIYVKGRGKADYIRKYTSKPVLQLDQSPALKPLKDF